MSAARYFARSASDRTEDWPFWFVADRQLGDTNRTAEVADALYPGHRKPGAVLTTKQNALALAFAANEAAQ